MSTERGYGLPSNTIEKLVQIFRANPKVDQVLIYGSRAKGSYKKGSDIDLTMLGAQLEWKDLQKIEREIDELLLPYKVDLSIYKQIDNKELKEHIARWGTGLM